MIALRDFLVAFLCPPGDAGYPGNGRFQLLSNGQYLPEELYINSATDTAMDQWRCARTIAAILHINNR